MKLILYCTKNKSYLLKDIDKWFLSDKSQESYWKKGQIAPYYFNGKIVAECDFEIEKIIYRETDKNNYSFSTETLTPDELLDKSCLTILELCKYIGSNPNWTKGDYGYAIHIKNLNIFDKPKELSEYLQSSLPNPKHIKFANWRANYFWAFGDYATKNPQMTCEQLIETFKSSVSIKKAPQNMCYCYDADDGNKYILISIHPEWLCKILNGEKTIEIRKKVLKEML